MWRGRRLVRADVTQVGVVGRHGRGGARAELHAERFGRDGGAHCAFQRGRRISRLHLNVELVHHAREEHEHFHACQHVAQTHAPSDTERHKELRSPDFACFVYETTGVELVGLVP